MKAILTYHSIDSSGSVISTSEDAFRSHVKWLVRSPVRVVSVPELIALGDDGDAVALTFDDGFANFGEIAARVLVDAGLSATVFVVTECVGGTNSWEFRSGANAPHLPLMDWHHLSRLHEQGFTIGAHTRTHANVARLDGAKLHDEMCGSAERIAGELGARAHGFAYPFGETSPAAVSEAAAIFSFACTAEFAVLNQPVNAHLLPRLDMYYFRDPHGLESFGTAGFARYIAIRGRGRRLKRSVSRALRKADE